MKLKSVLQNLQGGVGDIEITHVTSDSRLVKDGSIFVCIKGPQNDGHDFAKSALEKGAAVIVCDRDLNLENQVIVKDTHTALAMLLDAQYNYPLKKLKLIGVTGTNGKTSVCNILKFILESKGHKTGLLGTVEHLVGDEVIPSNNTTPGAAELRYLFAKMVDAGCEYAVMEVSSHALDQRRVEGIEFEAGIFTNLTQDHLDYHGSMEEYFLAKAKLFEKSKRAIINIDDDYGKRLAQMVKCECFTYSAKSDEADFTAKNIEVLQNMVKYDMAGFGVIGRIRLNISGKFSVYNSLAAAVCTREMDISLEDITSALSNMCGVKGRIENVPTGRDFTVIIDYAHTPDGLQNILATFRDCEKNRLVVLFGCGGDRDKTKRPIMGAIAARLSNFVIVTSDNPRTEAPMAIIDDILKGMKGIHTPYKVIENRVDAINYAIKTAKAGDIIILAGKGHETYQIIGTEKFPLDEREVVKKALEGLR